MTREEHIKWCKERAIKEIDYYQDPKQGIISMMSDLGKHPETNHESLKMLCFIQLQLPLSISKAKEFINGFN